MKIEFLLISKNCISYEEAVSHVETFVSNATHYNEYAPRSIKPPATRSATNTGTRTTKSN